MTDRIGRFVDKLAAAPTGELFNFYRDEVTDLDRPGGAPIRRANLIAYLESRIHAPIALIGEAPSAHGARFSGIAFTAERSLPPDQWTSTRVGGFTEHSATVLWRALATAGLDPAGIILWNVVPFHPMPSGDPLRNRPPRAEERALGGDWLDLFLDLMRPGLVVAVGQTALRAMPDALVVRHPANGGKPQLERDLTRLAATLRIEVSDPEA